MSITNEAGRFIAIVGFACRFPGIDTPGAFWRTIVDGRELVRKLSTKELRQEGVPDELLSNPNYVRSGATLADIFAFDAQFFGINATEAKLMDPQHRLFLELCYESLECASALDQRSKYKIGLYGGAARNTYFRNVVLPSLDRSESLDGSVRGLQADIGGYGDFLTTRASFKLNLTGPSVNVQTACSTSLMAVHMACQAILSGECELALAGGTSIAVPQINGYLYEEGSIASPDGHCRPFDTEANGTVFGNGGAMVLLKRLDLAQADGDPIHAVIRGTAANNDGSKKVSYSAPSLSGQAEVLREALDVAGVSGNTVGYIEAHGTATRIGDPIEVAAIKRAYGEEGKRHSCAIGSVKANLGHLGAAAGVASLLKAVLVLKNRTLPPMANHKKPNDLLELEGSRFFVPIHATSWYGDKHPRRAGVSSFGIGGTNVHVVLEEAPHEPAAGLISPYELAPVSAKSAPSLRMNLDSVAVHFRGTESPSEAANLAYSLAKGVCDYPIKDWLLYDTASKAVAPRDKAVQQLASLGSKPKIVFAFPGQGAQKIGMARSLYAALPSFAQIVDEVAALIKKASGIDIVAEIIQGTVSTRFPLEDTRLGQPALFTIEYSLAKWLTLVGVKPDLLLGHSIGAYSAAAISGLFDLSSAVALVCARAQCMWNTPEGRMLAVRGASQGFRSRAEVEAEISAINSPDSFIVAGASKPIEDLQRALDGDGVSSVLLGVDKAFHSRLMDACLPDFDRALRRVEFGELGVPMISDTTGRILLSETARAPEYWIDHIRKPVLFFEALQTACIDDNEGRTSLVIEVGPGRYLSGIVERFGEELGQALALPLLSTEEDEIKNLLQMLGELWRLGLPINWTVLYASRNLQRVAIPAYGFDRQTYKVESFPSETSKNGDVVDASVRTQRHPVLSSLNWVPMLEPLAPATERLRGAVVRWEYGGQRSELLRSTEFVQDVVFSPSTENLLNRNTQQLIIFTAQCSASSSVGNGSVAIDRYHEVAGLVRAALGTCEGIQRVTLVTAGAFSLPGDLEAEPESALLEGFVGTLPLEYPGVSVQLIDVCRDRRQGMSARQLEDLIDCVDGSGIFAIRNQKIYVREEERTNAFDSSLGNRIRQNGRYLITGGAGHIAQTFLETICRLPGSVDLSIVLVGRREIQIKSSILEHLHTKNISVYYERCDVTDIGAVEGLWKRYGGFDGIVHSAGLAGGSLLASRERSASARTLAPKVSGTRNLLALAPTDCWLILCSSVITKRGAIGQLDYAAANAYLDAVAECETMKGRDALSIAWGPWAGGGMAFDSGLTGIRSGSALASSAKRPEIVSELVEVDSELFYAHLQLGSAEQPAWFLDEHRLLGAPVLPGTGALAIFHDCAAVVLGDVPLSILDLTFLKPLVYTKDIESTLYVRIKRSRQGLELALQGFSRSRLQWETFTECLVKPADIAAEPELEDANETSADQLFLSSVSFGELGSAGWLKFGKGWGGIRTRIRHGTRWEVRCQLDSETFNRSPLLIDLHPGLLDTLLGGALFSRTDERWLPQSYKHIRINGRMTESSTAVVELLEGPDAQTLVMDATVYDSSRRACMSIKGYKLRRMTSTSIPDDWNLQLQLTQREQGIDGLTHVAAPRIAPHAEDIEVLVCASGINFKEVLYTLGMLATPKDDYMFGLECAGVVTRVGPNASKFFVGQRVMCLAEAAHSRYVVVNENLCAHIPDELSMCDAATIPVAFVTAYAALKRLGRLSARETVLIHAATGGVGMAAIQVARLIGAKIIATAGTPEKRALLSEMGIKDVYSSRDNTFVQGVLDSTNGVGADVILNSLAGELLVAGFSCLAPGGRFVEIGRRDVISDMKLGLRAFDNGRSLSVFYPDVKSISFLTAWREVASLIAGGELQPLPAQVYSYEAPGSAFESMARGRHTGKLVLQHLDEAVALASATPSISEALGARMIEEALARSGPRLIADIGRGYVRTDDLAAPLARLGVSTRVTANATDAITKQSPSDAVVAEAFRVVLELDSVPSGASFLSLGGDSLSATQVTAYIRRTLDTKISVADVLSAKSVAELALILESARLADSAGAEATLGVVAGSI